ncbi:hypothetical protein [Brucella anthropi]|uniref:hypothetical protein n=1 Tax=Brucella anthropi TaxID=529 RepID=UPI001CFE1B27|nr:hypothetical protein [Brucella anthropi]
MALSPELKAMVSSATGITSMKRGIIPIHPLADDAILTVSIAREISEAHSGPAISAYDLAERLIVMVREADALEKSYGLQMAQTDK